MSSLPYRASSTASSLTAISSSTASTYNNPNNYHDQKSPSCTSSTYTPSITSTSPPATNPSTSTPNPYFSPSHLNHHMSSPDQTPNLPGPSLSKTWKKATAMLKCDKKPSSEHEKLADDENAFEEQKKEEERKRVRDEKYKQLGLEERTKFGSKGGMGMNI